MRLFWRRTDEAEKLFQLFAADLKTKNFDLMVFDKRQIKKNLGRGMYKKWEESLGVLHHRKISIIFEAKESKICWPSNNYLDRLVVNIARTPDKEALLKAEKELLKLLELDEEVS